MSEILESTTVALSLAIYLVDEFTMQQPIGNLNVSVNGGKFVPVKNPSGEVEKSIDAILGLVKTSRER